MLREADHIVTQALQCYGLYKQIWQCPVAIAPLKIDGKGSELVMLRPVHSERAMTAKPADLPRSMIYEIISQLMKLPGTSGVALDVTAKPPATIEFE